MKSSFRNAKTAVIASLLVHERLSRLELCEKTGASPAAITEVTQKLLAAGLLAESAVPLPAKGRGRPTVQLSLQASHSGLVGLSLGEAEAMLVITDLRGAVLACQRGPVPRDPARLPAQARALFGRALREARIARAKLRGAGIAVSGIVEGGVCRYSAALDWHDVAISDAVSTALGMPAWVDNDANAIAVGDKVFGQAREFEDFSSVVLGRTIGSAHYTHGMLYRGHDGSAGEIGHIIVDPEGAMCRCGRRGCLDTLAGGAGLERAAAAAGLAVGSMRELEALAMRGDSTAGHLLRTAGTALGRIVAALVQMNNPQAVLFTDIEGFDNGVFRTATRQAIENSILPRFLRSTQIVFVRGEPSSLARSAASLAALNYLIAA